MLDSESENGVDEQHANWHPETTEMPFEMIDDFGLAGLEKEIPNTDATLAAESAGLLDYAKEPEAEQSLGAKYRNLARKFYEQNASIFQERVGEISGLFAQGRNEQARALGKKLIDETKIKSAEFLSGNLEDWFQEYEQNEKVAETGQDESRKRRLYKLAMEAIDFIPVIGSAKMVGEGLAGRTMSGELLSKGKRVWHATRGAVFLALDLTGVGIAAAEELKAGRTVTRTAALMRSVGMAREVYQPVYKTGRYLIENPAAAKLVDKSFERIIQSRKNHSFDLVDKGKKLLFDTVRKGEQELSHSV